MLSTTISAKLQPSVVSGDQDKIILWKRQARLLPYACFGVDRRLALRAERRKSYSTKSIAIPRKGTRGGRDLLHCRCRFSTMSSRWVDPIHC